LIYRENNTCIWKFNRFLFQTKNLKKKGKKFSAKDSAKEKFSAKDSAKKIFSVKISDCLVTPLNSEQGKK